MQKVSKEKKLVINTIIIFISKLCTQLLSILLLPLVTSKLSTSDYGSFDLITVYALFITAFMGLNIENGLFRYLIDVRKDEDEQKKIISSGIITMIFVSLLFTVIYFSAWIIFRFNNVIYIYAFALSSLYFNMFLQISRGVGDNLNYAIASIIVGVSNICLSILFLFKFNIGLFGLVYAGIISYIFGSIYIFLKKRVYHFLSFNYFNKETSLKIVKYSTPLVPNNISSWIMNISDKIMLAFFINNSATGIYSISTKFPTLLSHVYGVFNLSWTESASVNVKDNSRDEFFSSVINKIFIICFCLCIVTLSAMAIIFKIMIDPSYKEAYYYVPILIVASSFEILSSLLGAVYISLMKSKNIALSTTIAGLINILINLILIPKIGILAACISTAVSYFILAIYRYINLKKDIIIKLDFKKILLLYLLLVFLIIIYYKNSIIMSVGSIIISIIVSYFLNIDIINKSIKNIYHKVKKCK